MTSAKDLRAAEGFVATFIAVVVIATILNGWVLTILWGWFIMPVFNFPALSLVPGIGLALIVSYLTYQDIICELEDSVDGAIVKLFQVVIRSLFVLLFGWVLHLFM